MSFSLFLTLFCSYEFFAFMSREFGLDIFLPHPFLIELSSIIIIIFSPLAIVHSRVSGFDPHAARVGEFSPPSGEWWLRRPR